ncbi:putative ABC transporter ATP-binding protein YheS [Rhodobiaceae bacterium]|nr:putative ABC transporter ATP-binding protein YheS [Rhodobiaceae bacterium]
MLHINDITYRIDGRLLIDHATAAIPAGHKVGLVGRNGSGKSTLLKLITKQLEPETGGISLPKRSVIGGVAQEAPAGPISLIDTVLAANTERASLLEEAETATDPHRIAEIQTRLADMNAHAAPARAATILAGLGFDEETQARPCSDFSGGWRMRVALAAVLFAEPDLLLLDEPTNYLDLEGAIWLENYLKTYPYSVIIVSHDRDLLNRSVQGILHLDQMKLTYYQGGYDRFERTRREKQALQMAMKSKQEDAKRHMEKFVERFRYKASKARQAQSRLKALSKLEPIPDIVADRMLPFHFPNAETPLSSPIARMEGAAVGYEEGVPVLSGMDLRIDQDDRIALLGANGNGKSTFAKLLSNKLTTQAGNFYRSKKLRVAYFAQHQLDELHADWSAYDHFRELMPDATQAQVRARTGAAGFGADKADTKAGNLSGGEKARLLFSLATFHKPHLMILDEPTNHLDIQAREALVMALNEFEGAVILISHDRHLIEMTADRLWLIADGSVSRWEGDLADYQKWLLDPARRNGPLSHVDGDEEADAPDPEATRKQQRQDAAKARASIAPLRKDIEAATAAIEKARTFIERVDARLANGGLYRTDPDRAAELVRGRSAAQKSLDKAEDRWLRASEAYEKAKEAIAKGDDAKSKTYSN